MIFEAPYTMVKEVKNFPLHFHPDHLEDLRKSGLTDETIGSGQVYSLRPKDMSLFFGRTGSPAALETALCFPYQGGEFARIKLFPPVGTRKYSQPPKTSARLYVPLPVGDGDLVIAEGEKKTLAALQQGLNAVGIGGVWNWINHGRPIDDLEKISWEGRGATIIPDSDVFFRKDLMQAIYALGQELRRLGAAVRVARIPQQEEKVGLDDFVMAGGDIASLDTYTLGHGIFRGVEYWYHSWKFKRVMGE